MEFIIHLCVKRAGLLCLKRAKRGGLSSWSSSVAVHNEIVRRRPDLARVLASRNAWFFDRKGEVPAGKEPFFEIPVFNYHKVCRGSTAALAEGCMLFRF